VASSRAADPSAADALIARLEAVPFSRWHLRARLVVGSATFFDAFDALSLAFVLPVLVRLWSITPAQIGWLIATAIWVSLLVHWCSVRWPSASGVFAAWPARRR
jgi:putative MFS transporter